MSREGIHYWKCDRGSPFHGIRNRDEISLPESELKAAMEDSLGRSIASMEYQESTGNHLIWLVTVEGGISKPEYLVRVEDGPEGDGYLAVESFLLDKVRGEGVPTPRVIACDSSRKRSTYAWQLLENIPYPNLQYWNERGELSLLEIAPTIGEAIAKWQQVAVAGFGPFRAEFVHERATLKGYHSSYSSYFNLNLERHLKLLRDKEFISSDEEHEILQAIKKGSTLLNIDRGCLVHKDLALWNILGPADGIAAYIDWDDSIAGDPMDDVSLIACFHGSKVVGEILKGYGSIRPLPPNHEERIWLHLLRNMIVKSVIRAGASYFEKDFDFFLIGSKSNGQDFKAKTKARLMKALEGVRCGLPLTEIPDL